MKKILGFLLLAFLSANAVLANVAPRPEPTAKKESQKKSIQARMMIKLDQNANEAVLRLSKKQLKQLRASLDEIDDDSFNLASASESRLRTQTIMGGLFLSLAFVFGGVVFLRLGKTSEKINKTIVSGAIVFAFASAAAFVFANAGPPPELYSISSNLFDKKLFGGWNRAYGGVKVEVIEGDGTIELIVPDKEQPNKKDEE